MVAAGGLARRRRLSAGLGLEIGLRTGSFIYSEAFLADVRPARRDTADRRGI